MRYIKHHILPIMVLFVLIFVSHHLWFFNLSPITHGDWAIDNKEKIVEFASLPQLWSSDSSLGDTNFAITFWPSLLLLGSLTKYLALSPELTERLLILWPVALFSPLFMYMLAYHILKSRLSSFVAACVFSFNTILIIARSGPLLLHISMTYVPLLLLFFIQALETKKKKYLILSGITAIVVSFYEFRIFYIATAVLFMYTIFYISLYDRKRSDSISSFFILGITVSLPLFFNFYALYSLHKISILSGNAIFDRPLFGNVYIELSKIMSLFHYAWTGNAINPWVIRKMPITFYAVPLLAFSGYFFSPQKKKLIFWASLALIMILLAKQSQPPFTELYKFLFDYIPGFNAFRESGKFAYFVAMAYGVLIGSSTLIIRDVTKKNYKMLGYIVSFAIAFLFIWNITPIFTGDLGTLFVARSKPQDYIVFNDFINSQNGIFRTLSVPTASRWAHKTTKNPMLSNSFLNSSSWIPLLPAQYTDPYDVYFTDNLLDRSNIKYVLVPLKDKENDDNFFEYAGNREQFIKTLDNLDYLKTVDIGTDELKIYENVNYRPKIYATFDKESLTKTEPYVVVPFRQVTSTYYTVELRSIKKPFYLQFSETYQPDWRIRIGHVNWFSSIIDHNYFIDSRYHSKSDAQLNTFLINPKELCDTFTCVRNNDSYTMTLSIYFQSQSYIYAGLLISAVTVGSIFTCIYFFWQSKKIVNHKTF